MFEKQRDAVEERGAERWRWGIGVFSLLSKMSI